MIKKLIAAAIILSISVAPQVYAQEGHEEGHQEGHLNERNGDPARLADQHRRHACLGLFELRERRQLSQSGRARQDRSVNYTRTTTSRSSDSFPGLMALVTGGTPKLVGAYYDVAYDRVLAPPLNDTGNGVFSGPCTPNTPNGTTTEYEEGVEFNQTLLNGGNPAALNVTDGGVKGIDPTRLPRDPFRGCSPVYPWNFIRANTIYGVIHAAGGYTAWSDKHAVYASVSGPTGTPVPSNLDDYYAPDVNSNQNFPAGRDHRRDELQLR